MAREACKFAQQLVFRVKCVSLTNRFWVATIMSPKIQLGMGYGEIPDLTPKVNRHHPDVFTESGELTGDALGQFISCVYNKHHKYPDSKIVHGSLGLGYRKSPYWAAGGNEYQTMADFGRRWHSWLELPEGTVIDVVTPAWHELAARNRAMFLVGDPTEPSLVRDTYENLKDLGMSYIPAPQDTQDIMEEISTRAFAPVLEKLHLC